MILDDTTQHSYPILYPILPVDLKSSLALRYANRDLPMKTPKNIDVLFVAGFGPIVRDPAASRKFYSQALGLWLVSVLENYCAR